ncbi:MAG: hypothetical protein ABJA10_07465 [Aestuariivirga sp.]
MKKHELDEICDRMKVGQRFDLSRTDFAEANPYGWPSMYRTPEQAFLSRRIGAMYGAWKIHHWIDKPHLTIERCEIDASKITYVDPDQEHHFIKLPDGTFKHAQLDVNHIQKSRLG